MIYILNIETSTTNCSVSLAKDGITIDLIEDNSSSYSHAEKLHVFINDILKRNQIDREELKAVSVSKGPGSYTGLRIGVSAAKGLCFALNIPLIAVSTLRVLAEKVKIDSGVIIPMLDARRMEVYSAVYDCNLKEIRSVKAEILVEESFLEYLQVGKVQFIGNGVEKSKSLISHDNARFLVNDLPSAKEMSNLTFQKYKIGDFEDVAYFEPYYLKDFIAGK